MTNKITQVENNIIDYGGDFIDLFFNQSQLKEIRMSDTELDERNSFDGPTMSGGKPNKNSRIPIGKRTWW